MSARLWVMALLLINAATAAGADLGRMFFTPAQRETLDAARAKNIRSEISNENPQPAAVPAPPVAQNVSVDGLVRRSDGANTVWLNHRPVTGRQVDGLGVTPAKNDNRVKVTAPDKGRSVDLKVGQSVEIVSGAIQEGYGRRTVAKPQEKMAPSAANDPIPGEKSAPSPAVQPPKPTESAPESAARSKEPDARSPAQ